MLKISTDPKYKPSYPLTDNINAQYINCEVWIWLRSYNLILNVTNFISSLTVNNTKQSAGFNFSLENMNSLFGSGGVKIHRPGDKTYLTRFSDDLNFWSKHLSNNDIVWIKFEELQNENRETDWVVSKDRLAGQIYDLIGLVDNVAENRVKQGLATTVTVSGRDLSKLFHDDEAVFFPMAVTAIGNKEMSLSSKAENDILIHRWYSSGDYMSKFSKMYQSVGDIFSFWISVISNLGILPREINESFFSSYNKAGERTERLNWGNEITGDLWVDVPIVDVYTQTFRWDADENMMVSDMEIRPEDRRSYRDEKKQILHYGIYQIIKLTVDKRIAKRLVVDASVGNPDGSMMSMFNKICQNPFIEVLTDTYLDEYHIVVRQPPFNQAAIVSLLDADKKGKAAGGPGVIINIDPKFVTQTDLSFSQDIYTWFRLEPKGYFIGSNSQIALSYLPIVQLDEYVNIWGSKPLHIISNYMWADAWDGVGTTENASLMRKSAIDDMLYLIETMAYLPFTRTGRITLSNTNRLIKKGGWIRMESTGEIFYVDAVNHSCSISTSSIDSSTTITVSRGMIESHIRDHETINLGTADVGSLMNIVEAAQRLGISVEKASKIGHTHEFSEGFMNNFSNTYDPDEYAISGNQLIKRNLVQNPIEYAGKYHPSYFNIIDLWDLRDRLYTGWFVFEGDLKQRALERIENKKKSGDGGFIDKNVMNFFLKKRQFG